MNIQEWRQKTDRDRRRQILEWVNKGEFSAYENLAFEARGELERHLRERLPKVNVQLGPGEFLSEDPLQPCAEIILHVFNHPSIVGSTFCGFRVVQIDVDSRKQRFLKIWKRLFRELKNWDEFQTITWAQRWMDALEGRKLSAITHYGPVEVALTELVDDEIKKREREEGRRLPIYSEIRSIFSRNKINRYQDQIDLSERLDEVDWRKIKQEYEKVIMKYRT